MIKKNICLIVSDSELPINQHVWGTGGWIDPIYREGLDWLTLVKLLGLDVAVYTFSQFQDINLFEIMSHGSLIISAVRTRQEFTALSQHLYLGSAGCPCTLITRFLTEKITNIHTSQKKVSGKILKFKFDGHTKDRECRQPLEVSYFEGCLPENVLATLAAYPVVVECNVNNLRFVVLSFHPSQARDQEGCISALLKDLIKTSLKRDQSVVDLSGCVVLRMDDPGAAQNIYFRDWSYRKLNRDDWEAIGKYLQVRNGKMSVAYVSGFIDDGNEERGELFINGRKVPRNAGRIYPSPSVRYVDKNGHMPGQIFDLSEEYESIRRWQRLGILSLELHGYTHMYPDSRHWAQSGDRYTNLKWFRELGIFAQEAINRMPGAEHPLLLGRKSIHEYFGRATDTLVCPGDEWCNESLQAALDQGIKFVSSYYQALRHEDRFCWTQHLCSPYLDEADAKWFDSELPVIGYLHDRDIAIYGMEWFVKHIEAWERCGAKRFIDFQELLSQLNLDSAK